MVCTAVTKITASGVEATACDGLTLNGGVQVGDIAGSLAGI